MNQQKVGQFLKELRNEKSITQAELAEMLGVSNRSISRWENGATMPDFDLLIDLAKYFDIEVGEILDGKRRDKIMDKKMEEEMMTLQVSCLELFLPIYCWAFFIPAAIYRKSERLRCAC